MAIRGGPNLSEMRPLTAQGTSLPPLDTVHQDPVLASNGCLSNDPRGNRRPDIPKGHWHSPGDYWNMCKKHQTAGPKANVNGDSVDGNFRQTLRGRFNRGGPSPFI